jgi:hypothetical protein
MRMRSSRPHSESELVQGSQALRSPRSYASETTGT